MNVVTKILVNLKSCLLTKQGNYLIIIINTVARVSVSCLMEAPIKYDVMARDRDRDRARASVIPRAEVKASQS